MAEVLPLNALHYNPAAVSLGDVTAPPYDVIDDDKRHELVSRSPFNVVEIDLPRGPEGVDRYEYAAQTMESWITQGILTADREPALWPLSQEYTGPDGKSLTRRGLLTRVRLAEYESRTVRPHERTQPGPKEDRLRLTEATRHNLSPIFSLHPGDVWEHLEPALEDPWGQVTDDEGTVHRVWRLPDPAIHAVVKEALGDADLLIADGHHRYETSLAYAREISGDGPHEFVLMCLVSLEDPGLTVFPTHRLISGLKDPERRERLRTALEQVFELEEVAIDAVDPAGEPGVGVFGYVDGPLRSGFRLRLRDEAAIDRRLDGKPDAYRRLDAVILETLVLEDILGKTPEDIAAKRGIAYTANTEDALQRVHSGDCDAVFIMRPTPVEDVRAVAAAGETMPPKSTYFFPKLLTGLVFNPLS